MAMNLVSDRYNFSHHRSGVPTSGFLIHQHDCFELYYILSGDMRFLYDGTEYAPAPHTMILIVPGALHGIHILSDAEYDRYTFHFVPQLFARERQETLMRLLPNLASVRKRQSPIPFYLEHCERLPILTALNTILALPDRHPDPESQRFFAATILEGLLFQLYLMQESSPSFTAPRLAEADPPELAQVLDYLRRHPSDRITVDRLSQRFYISRSQLNNLFQRHFHTSVMGYVASQRLSYAQKLLQSGMPAAEVASAIGYSDYSTFYRAYLRHIGHPPAEDKGTTQEDESTSMISMTVPFSHPELSMSAPSLLPHGPFPDISFEDHAYDPLE